MTEWQPIETAPKDGTEVLVWCSKCALVPIAMSYSSAAYFELEYGDPEYMEEGWYMSWSYPVDPPEVTWQPTHWMPLPPPPQEGE